MTRSPCLRQSRWSLRSRLQVERLEDRALLSAGPALASSYGQLPITFEANQGQAVAGVDYVAHASGYTLSLSGGNATLDLNGSADGSHSLVQLQLVGSTAAAHAIGMNPSATKINYFSGSDPSRWHTNVPNFGRVEYANVYAGINLDYYSNHGRLEYDFVVAPGADAGAIRMAIQGAQASVDDQGNLVLHTPAGDVVEQAPVVYQDIGGIRHCVAGHFTLSGNTVGFQLGAYDHSRSLVIDPTIVYKSSLPPGRAFGVAVDSAGDAYIAGNGFVGELNPNGTAWVYLNNSFGDHAIAVAVDSSGNAYVTGAPNPGFPTTANAFSLTFSNAFVSKLDPSGNLLYSSYIPGGDDSWVTDWLGGPGGIAVDASGNMYVTGCAHAGLVTTAGAYQSSFINTNGNSDTFFAEFNPSLSGSASLLYSTYLGTGSDSGFGLAVDSSGNAYIAGGTGDADFPTTPGAYQTHAGGGQDTYIAKFNPSLSGSASLVYSTYLGGSRNDGVCFASPLGVDPSWPGPGIAVDSAGEAFIVGQTQSSNFPVTAGAFQTRFQGSKSGVACDGFVTKLNAAGSALVYSTFLGGATERDGATAVTLDAGGNATVTGYTKSTDFPTKSPVQTKNAGGMDAFVTTLNASGSALLFSTYLGGTGNDVGCGVALHPSGNIYMVGFTQSNIGFAYKIGSPYSPALVATAVATPSRTALATVPILPPALVGTARSPALHSGLGNAPTTGSAATPPSTLVPVLAAAPTNRSIFVGPGRASPQRVLDAVFANGWDLFAW